MKPTKSAYSDLKISDEVAGVTILAYDSAPLFAGHTHLAFEFPDAETYVKIRYRHVVFHLVALGSGFKKQMISGTGAGVLKQVPVGEEKFGFAGGEGAVDRARLQLKKKGKELDPSKEEQYALKFLGDWDRNLPADDTWTGGKKYQSRTVKVPPAVAKKGRMLCRKAAKGGDIGLETKKFHKVFSAKGTNCMRFALGLLKLIDIKASSKMVILSGISPPRAIQYGSLTWVGKK